MGTPKYELRVWSPSVGKEWAHKVPKAMVPVPSHGFGLRRLNDNDGDGDGEGEQSVPETWDMMFKMHTGYCTEPCAMAVFKLMKAPCGSMNAGPDTKNASDDA